MTLQRPEAQDIILVGGTGDLARRKLLPSLYRLYLAGLLPEDGRIIGYARRAPTGGDYTAMAREAMGQFLAHPLQMPSWLAFTRRLAFVSEDNGGLAEVARLCTQPRRMVYLATPPSAFAPYAQALAEHGLAKGTRLVLEKPFGLDLASARALDKALHRHFAEEQLYRIDHFMGKENVQNTLVFRFGNSLFERVWNRDAIDHVQLTVSETLGIEGRGAFYEEVGALRDMVQNHLFQVLSVIAMEPPASFQAEAIRDERVKVLHAMRPVNPGDVVYGQYTAGSAGNTPVPGYREEPNVRPDSRTETFVAMRLFIDNWRWAGVPFYVRTGKRLPRGVTEAQVVFREVPIRLFEGAAFDDLQPGHITLRVQPDEGITFSFLAKTPGPDVTVQPVRMDFSYDEAFMTEPQEAYERLLHDVMCGDRLLFLRTDAVLRAWELLDPVLRNPPPVHEYAAGTWGPVEAEDLIRPHSWHLH